MKYLEIESKWHLGLINHSILQDDKWNILSFEGGIFRLHDSTYLKDRVIVKSKNVPYIDIKEYDWFYIYDLNCYEAIEYIYLIEWKDMSTGRVKYYIILAIWTLCAVLFWIWYWVQLPDEQREKLNTFIDMY